MREAPAAAGSRPQLYMGVARAVGLLCACCVVLLTVGASDLRGADQLSHAQASLSDALRLQNTQLANMKLTY